MRNTSYSDIVRRYGGGTAVVHATKCLKNGFCTAPQGGTKRTTKSIHTITPQGYCVSSVSLFCPACCAVKKSTKPGQLTVVVPQRGHVHHLA